MIKAILTYSLILAFQGVARSYFSRLLTTKSEIEFLLVRPGVNVAYALNTTFSSISKSGFDARFAVNCLTQDPISFDILSNSSRVLIN